MSQGSQKRAGTRASFTAWTSLAASAFLLSACGNDYVAPDREPADTYALAGNTVLRFQRAKLGTPIGSQVISGLADGETLLGFDVRPADGLLYALSSAGKIYTIEPMTGVATLKSSLTPDAGDTVDGNAVYSGLSGTQFGVDFNPVPDRLRVVSDTGQNLRINVDTGATFTDGAINGASTGYAAAAYTSNFADACRTTLYAIDAGTDQLLIQSPPNNGTAVVVGPLGVNVDGVNGFDIVTGLDGVDEALASLRVGGSSSLYRINLQTGAATQLGALPSPGDYSGLALAVEAGERVQALGDLVGVTTGNKVVSFNQAAPAKLCTSRNLAGVFSGDKLIGLDYRPSTGELYAVTNASGTGRLYTVNPSTGAASNPVPLALPLTGTHFGVDFNPTGTVPLRIVSDTGLNLRVTDLSTGAATADTALNGPATGATAAAYTNSLPGTATTTLYVLDTVNDRLRIQNPPNQGSLVDVGSLNLAVGDINAFEIDGRNNLGLLVTSPAEGSPSSLHSVNLATGVASPSLGTVGGGQPLVGLTRAAPTTSVIGLTNGNALVRVSLTDATTTAIAAVQGLTGDAALLGIDYRPNNGLLYGFGNAGGIYTINPQTAVATKVSTLSASPADTTAPLTGFVGTVLGFDFNPTGPVALRIVSDAEQNLRVGDVSNGLTFTDTNLSRVPVAHVLPTIAHANKVPSASSSVLYALDSTLNKLVALNRAADGTVREIGAVGADVAPNSFLEIIGPNTAMAVLNGSDRILSTIDLVTGRATATGTIDVSGSIIGLIAPISAGVPLAGSTLYAITSNKQLVSFARNAPGVVNTIGTINVAAGETIVASDIRPSTGDLWILTTDATNTGRFYIVDKATAAASFVIDFAGLDAGSFTMDFSPTASFDLRLIADNLVNIRFVNLDTATPQVFADGAIGRPAPDVFSAAYSNSFVSPADVTPSTQLYVLDAATGSLLLQNPPNDGLLSVVGALSAVDTYSSFGGFDIAGGDNGIVLASLNRIVGGVPETFSRLYRINLTTGVATQVGNGVSGSATRLIDLAIQVR